MMDMFSAILPSDQEEIVRFQHRVKESLAPKYLAQASTWREVLAVYWGKEVAPIWDRFSFQSPQEADRVRSQLAGELLAYLPRTYWDDALESYLKQLIGWGDKARICWLEVLERELPQAKYLPHNTTELKALAELWSQHLSPALRHQGSKPSSVRGKRRHRARRQQQRLFQDLAKIAESLTVFGCLNF